jgi:hypothetical protein
MGLVPNRNTAPPGGYEFVDPSGVRFTGPSWAHVERRVQEHREANGIPVGDIAAEIAEQFCSKRPHLCVQEKGKPKAGALKGLPLYTKVLGWLAEVFSKVNQRVLTMQSSPREIKRRADICTRCRFQVAWREHSGCRSCLTDYQIVQRELMRGVEILPQTTSLQGCSLLAEDTGISVYVNQPESNLAELPAECWRATK